MYTANHRVNTHYIYPHLPRCRHTHATHTLHKTSRYHLSAKTEIKCNHFIHLNSKEGGKGQNRNKELIKHIKTANVMVDLN